MTNKFKQRDGDLFLEAEIIRKDGIIRKGITGKEYISFTISVNAGARKGDVHATMVAEIQLKNRGKKVCTLRNGKNDFCIPVDAVYGRCISAKVSARYKLGMMKSKTLSLGISRRF